MTNYFRPNLKLKDPLHFSLTYSIKIPYWTFGN